MEDDGCGSNTMTGLDEEKWCVAYIIYVDFAIRQKNQSNKTLTVRKDK